MTRTFTITSRHIKILQLVAMGTPVSDIATTIETERDSVYKTLKRLEREGFVAHHRISKTRYDYTVTHRGFEIVYNAEPISSTTGELGIQPLKRNLQRKHNLTFRCEILRKPENWYEDHVQQVLRQRAIPFHVRPLINWNQYEFVEDEVKIRTTPISVVFDLPDIYGDNTKVVFRKAWDILIRAVSYAENVLNVQLTNPRKENIMILNQHNSFIHNEIAEFCLDNGIHLKIFDENGDLRAEVDNSFGLKEFEFKHKKHQEDDSDRFRANIQAMYDGRVDIPEMNKMVAQTAENMEKMSGLVTDYAAHLNAHIPVLKELAPSLQEMRAMMKEVKETMITLKNQLNTPPSEPKGDQKP